MDENYLLKLFPKLKGINLSLVSNKVDPSSPENLFYSDIDGEWYFITMNFPMIFKAFSDETIDEKLKCLLEANNIKYEDYFESASIKMWNGDGFKIECPPNSVDPNKNMIMITNDNLVPVDVGIEELRTTDISEEVDMPEGYDSIINGIDHIYNGEEFCLDISDVDYMNGNDYTNGYLINSSSIVERIIYNQEMNYFTTFDNFIWSGGSSFSSSTPNELIDYR